MSHYDWLSEPPRACASRRWSNKGRKQCHHAGRPRKIRNVAGVISAALIAILLMVSLLIISNTIKLTTFDRREEIAIMKMVGATDGFIRWPFVFEGLLLGLFGAAIAFGLQWLLYVAIANGIGNSDTMQLLEVVPFRKIWQPVAAIFAGAGVVIGVGGSLMAIRRFLKV